MIVGIVEEPPEAGHAGASARREHARRKANRERAVLDKHPRIAGLLLALMNDPQSETAWARGAQGEERVSESLARHLHEDVVLLNDRRIRRSRANIDHIAVASSGIWVIDAKRYSGKVEVRKPLLGTPRLVIAGRDRSRLADGLAHKSRWSTTRPPRTPPRCPCTGRSTSSMRTCPS